MQVREGKKEIEERTVTHKITNTNMDHGRSKFKINNMVSNN